VGWGGIGASVSNGRTSLYLFRPPSGYFSWVFSRLSYKRGSLPGSLLYPFQFTSASCRSKPCLLFLMGIKAQPQLLGTSLADVALGANSPLAGTDMSTLLLAVAT
jgi:hypothetical protein